MDVPKKPLGIFQALALFSIKTVIVLLLLGIFMSVMLPDAAQVSEIKAEVKKNLTGFRKNFQDERAKLYTLSFIQNPAALYKISEIEERNGKVDNAMRDLELAIGLLEMHGAEKQVVKRYADRLEALKAASTKEATEKKNR